MFWLEYWEKLPFKFVIFICDLKLSRAGSQSSAKVFPTGLIFWNVLRHFTSAN